jgi:phosphatidylglycerol:prolipoprotein diacylglycerol transferase
MWEQLVQCAAPNNVAFCIPWPGGQPLAIYWYGILAAVGIFAGTLYAAKHVEWEGHNPDVMWDAFLWVLIPAIIGARVWYVLQAVIGGSEVYSLARPLEILNTRGGGMNIFGGAVFGAIALIVYARSKHLDGWLLADAGMLGLLIGQGIGRIGNYINTELYGPPTGSPWFGMLVPEERRLGIYPISDFPPETRFHPTMFYEAFWLFLVFGVLFFIFRRYQDRIVHGVLAGAYLIATGFGRFFIEFFRPDQPKLPDSIISYSQIASLLFIVVGLIALLDRLGSFKIPWIARPQTAKQRLQTYQSILTERRKRERSIQREKERERRRKQRELEATAKGEVAEAGTGEAETVEPPVAAKRAPRKTTKARPEVVEEPAEEMASETDDADQPVDEEV